MPEFHSSRNDTRRVLRLKEHDISWARYDGAIVSVQFETTNTTAMKAMKTTTMSNMRAATTFLLIAGLLAQQPSFAEPRERVGKSPWGADDLKGALHRHEGRLEEGDVVLIRTGQASHYQDAAKYLHEYPGVSLEAVKWLV